MAGDFLFYAIPILFYYHACTLFHLDLSTCDRPISGRKNSRTQRRDMGMALNVGITGLPNVGKSTLLNALAQAGAEASNYPFCTIDCNRGVVAVPDTRLEELAVILKPDEVIPSHITYIDIAGLVEGASRGEGLGNRFLHHVREADVLAHVLRCFEDTNVSHVHTGIDPVGDLEIVETELFLADLERVEKWIEKEKIKAKALRKGERSDLEFLETVKGKISQGAKVGHEGLNEHESGLLKELRLLTSKPVIIVLNSGEEAPRGDNGACKAAVDHFGGNFTIVISARLEKELAELPPGERKEFMREMGVDAQAKERFIEKCHDLLGLIRYYTAVNLKLQAWSVAGGTKAPAAAGMIHGDMEKGFIRARVMSFEDLSKYRSENEVQHRGLLRTEGHDYVIRDGDVVQYLFKL